MLQRVDEALYRAKAEGRNRVCGTRLDQTTIKDDQTTIKE
jgi:hypothetical protein